MKETKLKFDYDICNRIANIIINEHQRLDPKVKTSIWVTWVDRFFVLNGFTTLTNVFDISLLINDKIGKSDEDWTPINFVDLIRYGEFDENLLPYSIKFIDNISKHHYFFNDMDAPVRTAESIPFQKPWISEDHYGQSFELRKYKFLAMKIANHIFSANYTDNIRLISFRDDTVYVRTENSTVSEDFINNVVDACFGGRIDEEIQKMDLLNFDFQKVLGYNDEPYPWQVKDHMKDFMMI